MEWCSSPVQLSCDRQRIHAWYNYPPTRVFRELTCDRWYRDHLC